MRFVNVWESAIERGSIMVLRNVSRLTRHLASGVAAAVFAIAGTASAQITTQTVATGLANPLFVTQAPGDQSTRLFIVEQRNSGGVASSGAIRIWKNGALLATPFLTRTSVATGDEQGLLGLAFHPQYATNGKFYINYTSSVGGTTLIDEYTVSANPDVANAGSRRTILSYTQPFSNHNGGWMGFDPQGYLRIASGDGGDANDPGNRAQTIDNGGVTQYLGKILRIDVNRDDFPSDSNRNYGIPPGNFASGAGTPGAEIWAYGVRNPWRCSFDRQTGDFWIADVGQGSREEVNVELAGTPGGRFYGWKCREGTLNANGTSAACQGTLPPSVDPLLEYKHSGAVLPPLNANGCSITGGYVYRGCTIPSLQGRYLLGDYCGGWIKAWDRTTNTSINVVTVAALNLTSFGQDNDGEIYICLRGSGSNGSILKIVPTGSIADCNNNGHPDCADITLGRSADVNGDGIPDECQCFADFNADTVVDFFDYLDFVAAFSVSGPGADFNGDTTIDFFDYLDFVAAFSNGCP
jgi:glucose/arabinose dehydrogenase